MKKILVLGGTRFFGVHLINSLLEEGHEVIVATRGNVECTYKKPVTFMKADRHKLEDLRLLAEHGPFDLIYDQICMSAKNANDACIAFNGKCKKYIFTSTGSVYDPANDVDLTEDLFDPKNYELKGEDTNPYDYQEAKRQAEAHFTQVAPFPVTMVRFPIVVGVDDYSNRLRFHVERVKNQEEFFVPYLDMRMGYIQSHEAGAFLNYIGKHDFQGPVNAVSNGHMSLRELIEMIEAKTFTKAILAKEANETNHSPYGFGKDFMMTNKRGLSLGFHFDNLKDYMPLLVEHYLK